MVATSRERTGKVLSFEVRLLLWIMSIVGGFEASYNENAV